MPLSRGELDEPGTVDEPAQYEYGLLEDTQGAGVFAGFQSVALAVQQYREMLGGPLRTSRTAV